MSDTATYRQQFLNALIYQDISGGIKVIEEALASDLEPKKILLDVVNAAMDKIGQMQDGKQITLSEVYVIARICEKAIEQLMEKMPEKPASAGVLVIGTVEGDYHGLGRKIVATMLRSAGFEVHDLGMNVSAEKFVDAAVEKKASVICASALLLHTAEKIRTIREELKKRNLEDQIKLVAGGAALHFDRRLYRELGADAFAHNAAGAINVIRLLMRTPTT